MLDLDISTTKGPLWPDECGHGRDKYIGTLVHFECGERRFLDVYVHECRHRSQSICLRFGREPAEYQSLGLIEAIKVAGSHSSSEYARALELLLHFGTVAWNRKEA